MHLRFPVTLALLLGAAASRAGAAEFVPAWSTEGVWSSNVFRTLDKDQFGRHIPKEDDFSVRTGPDLRVREEQGDLRYDLTYLLRYEEFARLDGISSFDQFARANADWAITDRTSISGSDYFGYSESLGGIFDTLGSATATPIVRAVRQRITTNSANASVRHRLGPLWEVTLAGDNQFYDYGDELSSQSISTAGNVQLTRAITRRLVLGVGGMAQRQESSDDSGTVDTGSTFLQAFGIANYQFSRTLRLSMSAGPAWSMPDNQPPGAATVGSYLPFDVSTCPVRADGVHFVPLAQALGFAVSGPQCNFKRFTFVGDPNQTVFFALPSLQNSDIPFVGDTGVQDSLTYFGRFQVEKRWGLWRGSVGYSRSATNSSGLGTSTILDSFNSQLIWTPSKMWTVTLNGTLAMQTAISEARAQQVAVNEEVRVVTGIDTNGQSSPPVGVPVAIPFEVSSGEKIDNPIDIRTYRVELRGERQFTKNLSSSASASWYQQTNSGQLQDNRRTEIRFVLGVTWKFSPIPL